MIPRAAVVGLVGIAGVVVTVIGWFRRSGDRPAAQLGRRVLVRLPRPHELPAGHAEPTSLSRPVATSNTNPRIDSFFGTNGLAAMRAID